MMRRTLTYTDVFIKGGEMALRNRGQLRATPIPRMKHGQGEATSRVEEMIALKPSIIL